MTQRTFDSFCNSCSNVVTLNSRIQLTVVTAYGLNQLDLGNNIWPLFVKSLVVVVVLMMIVDVFSPIN